MTLDYEVIDRDGPQDRLLVFVHGYGQSSSMFIDRLPTIDPHGRFLVATPVAPFEHRGRRIWHRSLKLEGPEPIEQFHESLDRLTRLVTRICHRRHLDPAVAVIAGFSQGGALALGLVLADSPLPPPAGCLAFCGFAPPVPGLTVDRARPDHVPVLLSAASDDDIVPLEMSRGTAHLLDELGLAVAYREVTGGHTITDEAATLAGSWLESLAAGAPQTTPLPPGTSAGIRRMVEPLWSW